MKQLIHRLRRASGRAVPAGLEDEARWLLAVAAGDADAFDRVMLAHGPLVFAACQRVLRNSTDADDAFQATFLVLLRRARTVRPPLAPWLYSVAVRTALAVRTSAARRDRLLERYAREVRSAPDASGSTPDPDLRADIDRELMHLPERERVAIILCDLDGCSRPEAAARLGWLPGTLDSRLARGRQRLARRLARLGYAPASLFSAGGLFARPAVPGSLLTLTLNLPTGQVPSEAVLSLSTLGEKSMIRTFWAIGAAVAVTTLTAVAAFAWSDPPSVPPARVTAPVPASPAAPVAYDLVCHWREWVEDRGPKGELRGGHAVDRYKVLRAGKDKVVDLEAKALATPPARGPLSPDGKQRVRDENYQDGPSAVFYCHLILTDPAGKKIADVTPGGRRRDESPVWSSDGKAIFFLRERERNKRDTRELFRIDADGNNLKQLSNRGIWSFTVLPDGGVVCIPYPNPGDEPEKRKREVILLRGEKEEKLAIGSDVLAVQSDPEGKRLAYTRAKHTFGVYDLKTRKAVEVEPKGQPGWIAKMPDWDWNMYDPIWRPDGQAVAVRCRRPEVDEKPEPIDPPLDEHVGVFEWDGKTWTAKACHVGPEAEPFAWQAVRPAAKPELYTDDEAKALAEAAEKVVPAGESKPKRDVFPALKLDPKRFRDQRTEQIAKVFVETWQLSAGYDITWMAYSVFDDKPLESDDKKIYAVRIVPRKAK